MFPILAARRNRGTSLSDPLGSVLSPDGDNYEDMDEDEDEDGDGDDDDDGDDDEEEEEENMDDDTDDDVDNDVEGLQHLQSDNHP